MLSIGEKGLDPKSCSVALNSTYISNGKSDLIGSHPVGDFTFEKTNCCLCYDRHILSTVFRSGHFRKQV